MVVLPLKFYTRYTSKKANSCVQRDLQCTFISKECHCSTMCVYSNSDNDVPQVAQQYGTIAAHTWCRASIRVAFVVFCVHMYSFAGLMSADPTAMFSDTAITDSHSDTAIFQLTGWGYPGLLDRKNRSDMCP